MGRWLADHPAALVSIVFGSQAAVFLVLSAVARWLDARPTKPYDVTHLDCPICTARFSPPSSPERTK